jgi:hypothetical protein
MMVMLLTISLLFAALLMRKAGAQKAQAKAISNAAIISQGMSQMTHSLTFAYWSEDHGFNSSVVLNNAGNEPLSIRPVLYNLKGQPLVVSSIILPTRQQRVFNIAEWISQSGGNETFKQGNLILNFDAPDASDLGAQVTVKNAAASLSFDVPAEMPMSFISSRLEGLWQLEDEAAQYKLVLTNTTDSSLVAHLNFIGDNGKSSATDKSVTDKLDQTLAPHQTEVYDLKEFKLRHAMEAGKMGKAGGISITHTGEPGAVLAYGMVANDETGFSSHFPFTDPAERKSQTLAAAHMLIGKPDTQGFSPQTSFTSMMTLHNASDEAIKVTPTVSYTSGGKPYTVALATLRLTAQQIETVNIGAELKRAGVRGTLTGAGLTLTATGQPGALIGHLSSFDQTRNYVFDVPLKDPSLTMNRSGSYPWTLAGEANSVLHVRNTSDQKALFTVQLDYEGGSYTLPMQAVAPQQEIAVDIRALRDSQTTDSIKRVIPKHVTSGQLTWNSYRPQALIGRLEIYDAKGAVASSYSCPSPCEACPPLTDNVYTDPDSVSALVGEQFSARVMQTTVRRCDGARFGPFDVTGQSNLWINDASIASIGWTDGAGVHMNAVGVGNTLLNVEFPSEPISDPGGVCAMDRTFSMAMLIAILPRVDSVSPDRALIGQPVDVTINGSGFGNNPTVSAGTGISVVINSVSGTQIRARFNIAANDQGGNHGVFVTNPAAGTSNIVNFLVQIPKMLVRADVPQAPNGIGALQTPVNDVVRDLFGNVGLRGTRVCGVYRNYAFYLLDQSGQRILDPFTISEAFAQYHGPFSPPTADPSNIPANSVVPDNQFIGFPYPRCLAPSEEEDFLQGFSVQIGQASYDLSTIIFIHKGNDGGVLKVDSDIIVP